MRSGIATPGAVAHGVAEREWEIEARYWRAQYLYQPYYELGRSYAFYAPAYRVGYEAARERPGEGFEPLVKMMQERLAALDRHAELDWARAAPAARAAWLRVERGRHRTS